MQISITGQHIDITQALRAYIETKFARLERHFDNMTSIHVVVTVEKERQMAEATIHVSRGKLFANTEHSDMYAAIDGLVDKLDRQLKKHKEKLTNHHRGENGLKNQEAS
jgi:putative sigma-54 modulation protein